jgi:hypothetical protein
MPFVILLIGAIIVVAAYNNTHGQLASELQNDLPGFLKWALAIAAILALGWVPGLKAPSRWLLALVLLVIVVTNYKTILAGVSSFAGLGAQVTGAGAQAPDPTTLGATGGQPSSALTGSAPPVVNNAPPPPVSPFDPASYVGMFNSSSQGFGGSA